MRLFDFLRQIKRKISGHLPLIQVLIHKNNLLHNLNQYQRKYSQLKFAPVLKSNAYGHDLIKTAQILDKQDIPFLIVANVSKTLSCFSSSIRKKSIKYSCTTIFLPLSASNDSTASFTVSFSILICVSIKSQISPNYSGDNEIVADSKLSAIKP